MCTCQERRLLFHSKMNLMLFCSLSKLKLPERVSHEHENLCCAQGIVCGAHQKLKDFFFLFAHVPFGAPYLFSAVDDLFVNANTTNIMSTALRLNT